MLHLRKHWTIWCLFTFYAPPQKTLHHLVSIHILCFTSENTRPFGVSKFVSVGTTCKYVINRLNLLLFLIPTHAQQLVIIQWMDSCIPKEEDVLLTWHACFFLNDWKGEIAKLIGLFLFNFVVKTIYNFIFI
jgi:hypothetical protein